jgi:Ca2+-binding RTX toxin-like protein
MSETRRTGSRFTLPGALVAGLVLTVPAPAPAAAVPMCAGVAATIVGTPRNDTIIGTPGRDVIASGAGWDVVRGRGGDDLICAGDGADTLLGGRGDDRLYGGRGGVKEGRTTFLVNDRLVGGAGDDHYDVGRDRRPFDSLVLDTVDLSSAQRGVRVDLVAGVARGQGRDTLVARQVEVIGSDHDDVLLGSRHDETLTAGAGSDRVDGRGGDDLLRGDPKLPQVDRGADVMFGGQGDDYLYSVGGRDTLHGEAGNDQVSDDGRSRDRLYGGPGDDLVEDQVVLGRDQVASGGRGRNELRLTTYATDESGRIHPSGVTDLAAGVTTVEFARVTAVLTDRFSTVLLPRGTWTVLGTDAPERIYKLLPGRVEIHAEGGDDYLRGSEKGDDHLDGGQGYDVAQALGGDDTCVSIEEIEAGPPCETNLP